MSDTECICGDAKDLHTNGNRCTICPCRGYAPTPTEDDRSFYLSLADEFDPMGATTEAVLSDFDPKVIAGAKRFAHYHGIPLPWAVRSMDLALEHVRRAERAEASAWWL